MSNYSFSDDLISDLHKDAYGFRPKGDYFAWWNTLSDDAKQAEWDSLYDAFIAREKYEQELEDEAVKRFEAKVATLVSAGAEDRATAIRWLIDSLGEGYNDDIGYVEYTFGVPYGYIEKEFA